MHSRTEPIVDQVAHTLGELMRFWGFRDVLGRIWGLLYLSPEPVTPEQICSRLKISRGNVSVALAEMQRWGAVKRVRTPGQRTSAFVAETDLWKTISRVYRERERYEAERAQAAFAQALEAVAALPAGEAGSKAFIAPRLRRLQTLSGLATQFLDRLTEPSGIRRAAALGLVFKIQSAMTRPEE